MRLLKRMLVWGIAGVAVLLVLALFVTARDSADPPGGSAPIEVPGAVPPLPSPSPSPSIQTRFDEVDAALSELVSGKVAFNSPERMQFRETRGIALVASPQLDAASLSSELRQRIGGDDPIQVQELQIAPVMEAHVTGGPGFEVVSLTAARQVVSRAAPTEWRWNVRAVEPGRQSLHLTINALLTVDGERFPRLLNVLDREIEVDISAGQRVGMFVEGNWQWLAGTIVIPLALWFWSNRKRTRATN